MVKVLIDAHQPPSSAFGPESNPSHFALRKLAYKEKSIRIGMCAVVTPAILKLLSCKVKPEFLLNLTNHTLLR